MFEAEDYIGQYRVIKRLANTPTSDVYLVHCASLNTQLVVKLPVYAGESGLLTKSASDHSSAERAESSISARAISAGTTSRFLAQCRLMYALNGAAHLVSLMHIGQHEFPRDSAKNDSAKNDNAKNSINFLVMPYYPQTLADILSINQQKLATHEAISCIFQLAKALQAIHEKGVMHLDIKPQNVFYDQRQHVFLGDFDSAQLLKDSSLIAAHDLQELVVKDQLIDHRLTLSYASPEQRALANASSIFVKGETSISLSPRSDLFSLGMLAYRLMCGETIRLEDCDDEGYEQMREALTLHNAPQWWQELIISLTQFAAAKRPHSVSEVIELMERNIEASEEDVTQVISAETLYSKDAKQLRNEIEEVLLTRGFIDTQDKQRWAHTRLLDFQNTGIDSLQNESVQKGPVQKNAVEKDPLQKIALIELIAAEILQELSSERDLGNWFAWVKQVQLKYKEQGNTLNLKDYEHTLQTGRNSRPDAPDIADSIMQSYFLQPDAVDNGRSAVFSNRHITRFVIPLVVIASVFIYWILQDQSNSIYSGTSIQKKQPGTQIESTTEAENPIDVTGEDTGQVTKLTSNLSVQRGSKQDSKHGTPTHVKDNDSVFITNQPFNASAELGASSKPDSNNVNKKRDDYWRYQITPIGRGQNASSAELSPISFEMRRVNQHFAVMRTEVTNALYQMCVDDGACRKAKRYSTAQTSKTLAQSDEFAEHPAVMVSWYQVNEAFIPWLNSRSKINFSLPNLAHWDLYADANTQSSESLHGISHCKNCRNRLSQNAGAYTLPVRALPANEFGLYGVWGNAQEWLADCAVQNQIERCDQALVIGGSWIDNHDTLSQYKNSSAKLSESNAESETNAESAIYTENALLKHAGTPTTGFRLIEILDE